MSKSNESLVRDESPTLLAIGKHDQVRKTNVDGVFFVACIVAGGLAAYLAVALLVPEKFS